MATDQPTQPWHDPDDSPVTAALLAYLHDNPAPAAALERSERELVEGLAPHIAALPLSTASSAPPLADDPIAIGLGLVPDVEQRVNSNAVKARRLALGLKASELAQKLTARGWRTGPRDIMEWESRS